MQESVEGNIPLLASQTMLLKLTILLYQYYNRFQSTLCNPYDDRLVPSPWVNFLAKIARFQSPTKRVLNFSKKCFGESDVHTH